uniref:Uncharacterized protein n=1 Tax=Oryza meridionalis TaxID=40149 RepID=A0A0E0ECY5_9ORYZ
MDSKAPLHEILQNERSLTWHSRGFCGKGAMQKNGLDHLPLKMTKILKLAALFSLMWVSRDRTVVAMFENRICCRTEWPKLDDDLTNDQFPSLVPVSKHVSAC